jgi:ZIP family zinc transporter
MVQLPMDPFLAMLVYTTGASAGIPLGGLLARIEHLHPGWIESEFRHFVIAFGGGVLLAAVALVLLPQGLAFVPEPIAVVAFFMAGGLAFFALERWLGLRRRESPQLTATLLDYIPECLALGGMFAVGAGSAPLLALLIGLQNLPEGFNAFREQASVSGTSPSGVLLKMTLLVPIGPVLGMVGWLYLSTYTYLLGALMLIASGGILYLIFQDIAPMSRLRRHWFPPLGAVCGFGAALLGKVLLDPE